GAPREGGLPPLSPAALPCAPLDEQPATSATERHAAAVSGHARRQGLPRFPTPCLSTLAGCATDLANFLGEFLEDGLDPRQPVPRRLTSARAACLSAPKSRCRVVSPVTYATEAAVRTNTMST